MASTPSVTAFTRKRCRKLLRMSRVKSVSAGLSSTSRTSASVLNVVVVGPSDLPDQQCELERRTFTGFGLNPYPPAMVLHYFLADGETDAAARVLLAGVQALENYENRLRIFGTNTDSVIGYRKYPLAVLLLRGN